MEISLHFIHNPWLRIAERKATKDMRKKAKEIEGQRITPEENLKNVSTIMLSPASS